MRHRGILWSVAWMMASANAVSAQRIHGMVRDSLTGIPIAGAVVWVTDSSGGSLARSIGDEHGGYSIARFAGSTRLHVVRIGFHPRDLTLARDASDSTFDIRLEALPPNLATVSASSSRVCPGQKGSGEGLELWEQARAALLASVVSREAHPPHIRLVSYSKTREPVAKRLTSADTKTKDLVVDRSFVAARPPWAFAAEGYMREDHGGARTYFAPDDETLLDPTFAETHCMHVQRSDKAHLDQVGIAFDPVQTNNRDTLVEVRGVVWLDREHPALRSLEFHYTGLEPVARESGGEVFFHVMPNGAPMVERWVINTAMVADDPPPSSIFGARRNPPPRERRTDARRVGLREVGGEVAYAQWPDGTSWRGGLPHVVGTLVDDDDMPVAGARVWMLTTKDTVTTDSTGHFELPYVLPGVYYVLATDSVLADFGISRSPWTGVSLVRNADVTIRVRYHPRADALRHACSLQGLRPGTGVVLVHVLDTDGNPVDGARVDVWSPTSAADAFTRAPDRGGESGEDGTAMICGAPLNRPLRIRASDGDLSAEVRIDMLKDDATLERLVLRPRAGQPPAIKP